jgi:N6-adenosine-specific RNA methylase IME4
VSRKYQTMPLDEIKALSIPAADDCLLFMWTTNPFLADGSAAAVVRAWGFKPKTVLTWAKVQADGTTPSMKTGHWFRSASEHIIFAVRGGVRRPLDFPALPTWRPAPRLPHSVKPDLFYEWIEQASPGPYLELFARRTRRRWTSWGNEL